MRFLSGFEATIYYLGSTYFRSGVFFEVLLESQIFLLVKLVWFF